MAAYVMADLHLSTSVDKKMDKFRGWENYENRIVENWKSLVKEEDTVVLPGDISWGMNLDEALSDLMLIENLPGKKYILKGNHEYWWESITKMKKYLADHGIKSIDFIHNNSVVAEGMAFCGTRGWMIENETLPENAKIIAREEGRLRASLESAKDFPGEKVVFLHYPPVFMGKETGNMIGIMKEYGVKRCYYGHLHGKGHAMALQGNYKNIEFHLISADFLKFMPVSL